MARFNVVRHIEIEVEADSAGILDQHLLYNYPAPIAVEERKHYEVARTSKIIGYYTSVTPIEEEKGVEGVTDSESVGESL